MLAEALPCEKIHWLRPFSALYAAASPEEQAALRVWMRDIVLPRTERRNDLAKSRRYEKDSVAARDRRILEFDEPQSGSQDAQRRGPFYDPLNLLSNFGSWLLAQCSCFSGSFQPHIFAS